MAYIDYRLYLQNELDAVLPNKYEVTRERNNDVSFNKTNIVIKELAGNVYSSSANLPHQLDIYTSDPQGEIDFFKEFIRTHNQTIIESAVPIKDNDGKTIGVKNYQVLQTYSTPTVMEADIENFDNVAMARVSIFANLFAMEDINDIRKITIDGEPIACMERNLTYSTEIFSNRISGKYLNENNVKSAATSLTLTFINKNSIFGNKIAQIRQGKIDGNYKFNVELTMSNGVVENYVMILQQSTLNSAISKLPSGSVSLVTASPIEEV